MTSDFTYTTGADGFTSIMPNNKGAENCYNSIFAEGVYRLMPHELKGFKAQAKRAGYSVRKDDAKGISMDDLMAELWVNA